MGTSTIVLTVAVVVLTVAAAAIGFFAGRASAPDDHASVISERTASTTFPKYEFAAADEAVASNPRAQLLHALQQPPAERNRAIRVAMNAWLAADGAAAIMAVRDDPQLGEVADRMTQLALFAYPEIFVDNPSLLEGIPDRNQSIAAVARAIAVFDPDAAREMIETHLSGSIYRDAMLEAVDQHELAEQDPRAELESIMAGTGMGSQYQRLSRLVNRLAADDPLAAAEMIDGLPAPLRESAIHELTKAWSRTDPETAARWLAGKNVRFSGDGLNSLARRWGQSDFEAANAFADTLTGSKRALFLTGLAGATEGSKEELLAWVSRYEGEPAYPDLMVSVVQRFAQEDVGAAMALIETLPERIQPASYGSVVRSLAFGDPEAAVALLEEIGNESVRDNLVPVVSQLWARNDAESALEWARDLSPGRPRDQAIASIASALVNLETDLDIDHVIEVIDEIEDPELRKNSVWPLLFQVESDDEAIRIGRDYGVDRNHVLAIRGMRGRMLGPALISEDSPVPFSLRLGPVNIVTDKSPDPE